MEQTETAKPTLLRGYAQSGPVKVNYSIPAEHLKGHKDVLDVMTRGFADLLNMAAEVESFGVGFAWQLRQLADQMMRFSEPEGPEYTD